MHLLLLRKADSSASLGMTGVVWGFAHLIRVLADPNGSRRPPE
jgi:hypothetical protein